MEKRGETPGFMRCLSILGGESIESKQYSIYKSMVIFSDFPYSYTSFGVGNIMTPLRDAPGRMAE